MDARQELTPTQVAQMYANWCAGQTPSKLAKDFGVMWHEMLRYTRDWARGVVPKPPEHST